MQPSDPLQRFLCAAVVLLVGTGCGRPTGSGENNAAARGAAAGKIELKLCEWASAAKPALCGEYPVYENRAAGSGRTIRLPVVVLPATGGAATRDPLVMLSGGPGIAATGEARELAEGGLEELRRTRDILLVDQRGTGANNPLPCDLVAGEPGLKPFTGDLFPVAGIKKCAEQWEADPRFYHTTLAVEDLEEVRAALGYEQLNLYGISYGTRYAQVYARKYPQRVRTLLLEGVVAMSSMLPLPFARGSQRSLGRIFDECARDQGCAAAYPRLREEFAALLERLGKGPVKVRVREERGGIEETMEFSRELLATTTRSILYNTQRISRLPKLIHDAYHGNFTEYAQMAVSIRRFHLDNNGMYLAVVCADDVDFIDPARVTAETAGTFIGDYWYRQVAAACAVVPHGKAPADFHTTVRIDAPALLLSGYLDPSTPPEMGDEVAAGLPNGAHVMMRNRSHGTEGPDDYACADRVIAQFVERGTARGLNTSCLQKLRPRPFVLPH